MINWFCKAQKDRSIRLALRKSCRRIDEQGAVTLRQMNAPNLAVKAKDIPIPAYVGLSHGYVAT